MQALKELAADKIDSEDRQNYHLDGICGFHLIVFSSRKFRSCRDAPEKRLATGQVKK